MLKLDYLNAALHYAAGDKAPKKIIRVIYDITYRCNLRCEFCYYWNKDNCQKNLAKLKPGDELSTEEIRDVMIPQLKRAKVTYVTITGGELMVRNDIAKVLEMLSKHFKVCLLSNLSICDNEKLDAMIRHAHSLAVSLDLEEVFNKSRGVEGSYEEVIENIKYVTERRKSFLTVNCVITPENCDKIARIVEMAKELGVGRVTLQFMDWQTAETIKQTPFLNNPELYGTLVDEINVDAAKAFEQIQIAKKKAKEYGIECTTFPPRKPLTEEIARKWYSDPWYEYASKCLVPYFQLRISPYGDVMPCIEYKVGNIRNEELLEIWNNKKYRIFRRMLKNRIFPRCNKCCKVERSYNHLFHLR